MSADRPLAEIVAEGRRLALLLGALLGAAIAVAICGIWGIR